MEDYTTLHTLDSLGTGDHLCCIYQTEEEHRSLVTPFISKGLERNEKVLYIVEARTAKIVLGYFQSDDLKVKRYLKSGQLSILTADDSYMRSGTFDPDGMIALLRAETEKALDEGFSALRVTGEMSWALKGLPGSERLIEYESKLNDFFPGSKCLAICQYDRRLFDPELLLSVIATHPMVVVGTEIFENFYYLPPSEFFGADLSGSILNRWLSSLKERRNIEEELRERHSELQIILDSLDAYLFHKDRAGRHVFVNRALADSTGIPEDEWKGKTIVELLSGSELAEKYKVDDEEVMESGKPKKGIIEQFESPEGTRWARTDKVPLTDEDGNTIGLIGLSIDITNLKRTEQELEESEEKYRKLTETLPQVVFETDDSGKLTYVNKKGLDIFGYTEEDVEKGVNALLVIDPSDHERVAGAIQKMMDGRSTGAVREYLAKRKDGTTFPAVVYSNLVADTDGKAIGIRGVLTDITERKRYEEELERVNAELKGFAHTISHDLRGPLATLMGANKTLELLLRDPDVEDFRSDIREMTEIIDNSTARAEKLITDVLSLAETAQVPQEVSDVAVREVVARIIEEQLADIEEREIDVRVEKNLGIVVANPTHVYQVFANLIGNAIKHNDSDSPVLEISRSGDGEEGVHRYLIRDNGSGIPADILDSVFNPFIKGKGGSSGVGLAIVKKIVKVYGGDISAYNDNGACFELTLKDYVE